MAQVAINLQQALINANPGVTLSSNLIWYFVGFRTSSLDEYIDGTFSIDGAVARVYFIGEEVGSNAGPTFSTPFQGVGQFVFRAIVTDPMGFDDDMLVVIDVDQVWRDGNGEIWSDGANSPWIWNEFK